MAMTFADAVTVSEFVPDIRRVFVIPKILQKGFQGKGLNAVFRPGFDRKAPGFKQRYNPEGIVFRQIGFSDAPEYCFYTGQSVSLIRNMTFPRYRRNKGAINAHAIQLLDF
jgi:hypothetical protein